MCDENAKNGSQEYETVLALDSRSVAEWDFAPGPQRSLRLIPTLINTAQRKKKCNMATTRFQQVTDFYDHQFNYINHTIYRSIWGPDMNF